MQTMKAVRVHEYGGPEVLRYEDAPRPTLEPDDVLVRVRAAGVNPVDSKKRTGYREHPLPFIPGWDLSGVVERVGDRVSEWAAGDEVFARPDIGRDGSYAEFIAVRASELAPKPASLSHTEAAAVPLAALTAWQALYDEAGLQAGQSVLIHAAAGGVGHYAVQLAKLRGAHVIGTASTGNHDFLRRLGADECVDYRQTRFEDVVRDVDVVFDTIGGETRERSWGVLRKGGIQVSIIFPPPERHEAEPHGVRAGYVFVQPNRRQLDEIRQLVDSGRIRPYVQAVVPLAEARRAHETVQAGHTRGKIVLEIA